MSLPTQNPPVPTDYEDLRADWSSTTTPVSVAAGTKYSFPPTGGLNMPPVHGSGIVGVLTVFEYDVQVPTNYVGKCNVVGDIGVSNPSEFNEPMRPYIGVKYDNAVTELGAGESAHVAITRYDSIDRSDPPPNIDDWDMNPGAAGGTGRQGYPSLQGEVNNNGTQAVTVTNLQILSHVL